VYVKYVEELMAAVPELKIINPCSDSVEAMSNIIMKLFISAALQMPMVSSDSRH
jgi:hypothetical protein